MRWVVIALCLFFSHCTSWGKFFDVAEVGGTAMGVYYPVKATLNSGKESISISKNQSTFSFASIFETGSAYSIAFDNSTIGQTCTAENATGITSKGANTNATLSCVNTHYGFYGTSGTEQFNGIVAAPDGGTVVVGSISNTINFSSATPAPVGPGHAGAGVNDVVILKLTAGGDVEWHNYFGSAVGVESGNAIALAPDGGYVILGTTATVITNMHGLSPVFPYAGSNDLFVIKVSSTGALQWYTFVGDGTQSETGVAVSVAGDGNIYLATNGSTIATLNGIAPLNSPSATGDMYIIKLNSTGSLLWWSYVGGSSGDTITSIMALPDSGVAIAGTLATTSPPLTNLSGITHFNSPPPGGSDGVVVRMSAAGAGIWAAYIGSTGTDTITGLRMAADNNLIITGTAAAAFNFANYGVTPPTILPYTAGNDVFAIKISLTGTPQWLTYLGSASGETAGPITATSDGGLVVIGQSSANIATIGGFTPLNPYNASSDWLQLKLNASGVLQWWQFMGSAAGDQAMAITETADKGLATAGFLGANLTAFKGLSPRNSYVSGVDAVVIKVNANGGI